MTFELYLKKNILLQLQTIKLNDSKILYFLLEINVYIQKYSF